MIVESQQGHITVIVNPKSGARSRDAIISHFEQYLRLKGYETLVVPTTSMKHARQLAQEAANDPACSLVVSAGGDGTVREIVQGLAGSMKKLMILPCGTENLLAKELGLSCKPKRIIEVFENGDLRSLDLAKINDGYFLCVAGFGFDGEVVKRVSDQRKGHISHMTYFWPLWKTFWTHRFPRFQVSVDGNEVFNENGMVFVGNIARYAIGLNLLRHADSSDGKLDVCMFKCCSKLKLLKHAINAILRRHDQAGDVVYKTGKKIEILSPEKAAVEIDGDPGPDLPVHIEAFPQAVTVCVHKDYRLNHLQN